MYDSGIGARDNIGASGTPGSISADIDSTRSRVAELGDPGESRSRQAAAAVKAKVAATAAGVRTDVPAKARQAGRTVRDNPAPAVVSVLVVLASAVAGTILSRRTRQARRPVNRWQALLRR